MRWLTRLWLQEIKQAPQKFNGRLTNSQARGRVNGEHSQLT